MNRAAILEQIANNAHTIKRETHAHLLQVYGALGISPAQVELLKLIHLMGPLSHKTLAKEARLTPGAVTQLLDGLESADCIVRTADPSDRRISLISISPSGEQRFKAAAQRYREILTEAFETLSDEELRTYSTVQQKLIDWHKHNNPTNKQKEL